MIYDFSKPTCRRGTNSYKWDSAAGDDIIPLWVADMDFETYPGITEALRRRVDHAIFGYTRVRTAIMMLYAAGLRNDTGGASIGPTSFTPQAWCQPYQP